MTSNTSKNFGLWTLTFLVVANMVGAGVFVTSGWSMGDLASPAWVVAAWVVGGLIALAGASSYGKLIQHVPESGGEYVFLSRAYHPMLGFIAGWVSMFAGFTAAIAVAALTLAEYLVPIAWADFGVAITVSAFTVEAYSVPDDQADKILKSLVAFSVVVIAALLHGFKVRLGARAQNIAVILKLGLLLAFLGIAFFNLNPSQVTNDLEPLKQTDLPLAFCKVLMWIALSYMGFNAAVYIADEVPQAQSIIPKSLILGTLIVTFLYVALNYVFVYSADASVVKASQGKVAAMAAENLGGSSFRNLFVAIISIALFTSVTSMMMAAPRVYAKMADDGMLPSLFSFKKEAPVYAIMLQVVLAGIIIWFSNLKDLLGYLGVTLSLCAAASVSSLFLRRYREGRPIFSLHFAAPIFYVASTILAVVMTIFYNHISGGNKSVYAALITFAVGAVLYGIKRLWSGPAPAEKEIQKKAG